MDGIKAGMAGVDRDRVKQVVQEMSEDSAYYKNQQARDQQTQLKIDAMLVKYQQLLKRQNQAQQKRVDQQVREWENSRDTSRWIACVDLDAFFASVEELDDPTLKSVPMAVGGLGMLSTSNYEARKFGVRSAMPGFIAMRLCPQLKIVKPHFDRYKQCSQRVREVMSSYDPQLQMCSLDEGFLDLSEYMLQHEVTAEQAVSQMRAEITRETGLTASAGIACNRLLAKIASNINKPNGQYLVSNDPGDIREFMRELPVRQVSGIGRVTEKILAALGIQTCQYIWEQRYYLSELFQTATYEFLVRSAIGLGSTQVGGGDSDDEDSSRKSVSVERTFGNESDPARLVRRLQDLCTSLAEDLAAKQLACKCVTLKVKDVQFRVRTRAYTTKQWVHTAQEIFTVARPILDQLVPCELRLMGVRASTLASRNATVPFSGKRQPSITQFFSKAVDADTRLAYTCPICSVCITEAARQQNNQLLNEHVDECLNMQAIKQLDKQQ